MITARKIAQACLAAIFTASIFMCSFVIAAKATNNDIPIQRVVADISCDIDSCKPKTLSIKLHPKHPTVYLNKIRQEGGGIDGVSFTSTTTGKVTSKLWRNGVPNILTVTLPIDSYIVKLSYTGHTGGRPTNIKVGVQYNAPKEMKKSSTNIATDKNDEISNNKINDKLVINSYTTQS